MAANGKGGTAVIAGTLCARETASNVGIAATTIEKAAALINLLMQTPRGLRRIGVVDVIQAGFLLAADGPGEASFNNGNSVRKQVGSGKSKGAKTLLL